MINNIPSFALCTIKWRPVLHRYASFIIRNSKVAGHLVDRVFELLWSQRNALDSDKAIRTFLHINTRIACHTWLQKNILSLRCCHPDQREGPPERSEGTKFEKP
jgi:hypothetical protein